MIDIKNVTEHFNSKYYILLNLLTTSYNDAYA